MVRSTASWESIVDDGLLDGVLLHVFDVFPTGFVLGFFHQSGACEAAALCEDDDVFHGALKERVFDFFQEVGGELRGVKVCLEGFCWFGCRANNGDPPDDGVGCSGTVDAGVDGDYGIGHQTLLLGGLVVEREDRQNGAEVVL